LNIEDKARATNNKVTKRGHYSVSNS